MVLGRWGMLTMPSGLAVVFGGSTGIGRATMEAFASVGTEVLVADIVPPDPPVPRGVAFVRADVRDDADVTVVAERAVEQSALCAVVNVVGGAQLARLDEYGRSEWQASLDFNLTPAFRICATFIPHLRAQRSGSVVLVGSSAGSTALPNRTAYSAAKAGLIGFMRPLAAEIAPAGVRVNVVSPGAISTARAHRLMTPEELAERRAAIPLGRLGQPADVAAAVVFLASEQGSFITGQTLHVNGGAFMP